MIGVSLVGANVNITPCPYNNDANDTDSENIIDENDERWFPLPCLPALVTRLVTLPSQGVSTMRHFPFIKRIIIRIYSFVKCTIQSMSCSIVLLHSISCNLQHQIALQWQHCSVLWLIKSNILVYLPFAPSDGNPVGAAVSTVNTHIHPSNRVFPLKEKGPSSVILHLLNPFDFEDLPKYVKLDPKCCKNKKNL